MSPLVPLDRLTPRHILQQPILPSHGKPGLARCLTLSSCLVLPALAAAPVLLASPALAACDPAATTGQTSVCSGDTTNGNFQNGFGSGLEDDVTLIVNEGATVTGLSDGVALDENATITNNGSITGGDDGVELDDNATITNNGVIVGTVNDGVGVFDLDTLTNNGFITGGDYGVIVNTTIGTLINGSGASITGTDFDGVYNNQGITMLTNDGSITGGSDGIQVAVGDIETLMNSGTITGTDYGIFLDRGSIETLTNSSGASITGLTESGIRAADDIGTLTNDGSITGEEDGVRAGDDIGTLINGSGASITGTNGDGVYADEITTLTNEGSITGGDYGIIAEGGDIETLTNGSGASITGRTSDGIYVEGDVTTLTNEGSITGAQVGIDIDDDIGTLTNSSGASITGLTQDGIRAENVDTLTNDGSITGGTTGVDVGEDIGTLTNSSGASIIGLTDQGIKTNDNVDTLTNHGSITGETIGVDVGDDLGLLINTGTIAGDISVGVEADHIAVLINSGTISGGFSAISEDDSGGDTILTLNAGSVLIGDVDLGGGTNTLNIGAGLSIDTLIQSDNGTFQLGETDGHLVVTEVTGGIDNEVQVVAVDSGGLTGVDASFTVLTGAIAKTVQTRQANLRAGVNGVSGGDLGLDGHSTPQNTNHVWVEAFGSYGHTASDRVGAAFDHVTGGVIVGGDVAVDGVTNIGIMAGGAVSAFDNDTDTQTTDATSFFGGVYASTEAYGLAWDATLTIGHNDYTSDRAVANNAVATGIEIARSAYDGWFIAPQLTVTRYASNPFAGATFGSLVAAPTLEQSLTLRYAGLFLDSYTETGITTPLTVDERSVHIVAARAALALPFDAFNADGSVTSLSLHGGVEASAPFGGDDISGSLLGQAVSTALDTDDATFGSFIGLSAEHTVAGGFTLYADTEALLDVHGGWYHTGTIGMRLSF